MPAGLSAMSCLVCGAGCCRAGGPFFKVGEVCKLQASRADGYLHSMI